MTRTRPALPARLTVWADAGVLAVCLAVGAWGALLGGSAAAVGRGAGGLGGVPPLVLLGIAAVLGLPAAVHAALRHQWRTSALLAVGPVLLGFGYFFLPHAVDPCTAGLLDLGSRIGSAPLCEFAAGGLSVDVRFHLLEHALVTTLLLVPWAALVLGVRPRPGALLAGAAGLAWAVYGALELVQPFGADTRYDEARAYDVVLDRALFALYGAPGSTALLLSSFVLLAVARRLGVASRGVRVVAAVAGVLAAVSAAGVVAGFDPAFTSARIAGTLLLGTGVLLAARRAAGPARVGLLALGALAVFLLPLWPLVHAVQWLTPGTGAAVFALHGLGWALAGTLAARPTHPALLPAQRSAPAPAPHAYA
jgi:hypothetical protein